MKHQRLFAAAIVISAVACTPVELKDGPEAKPDGIISISATLESPASRAAINEGKITWTQGDDIKILLSNGNYATLTLDDGCHGKASATFSGTIIGEGVTLATEGLHAFYPAAIAASASSVSLPSEYAKGEYLDNSHALMKGAGDGSLTFKHLGGVIRFKLGGLPASSSIVKFTTLDHKNITGELAISSDGENEVVAATEGDGSHSSIEASFSPLTEKSDIELSFPVPVGTYEGIRIEVFDSEHEATVKAFEAATAKNTISRAERITMPKLTFVSIVAGGENTKTARSSEELTAAITALASTGGTIELSNDITIGKTSFEASNPITIDLQKNTLTTTGNIIANSDVNIVNGSISGSGILAAAANNATLSLDQVSVTSSAAYALLAQDGGTIEVSGSTINSTGSKIVYIPTSGGTVSIDHSTLSHSGAAYPLDIKAGSADITNSDMEFTGTYGMQVFNDAQLNLTNTNITNTANNSPLTVSNSGVATINGGTITNSGSANVIYQNAGTITMTGTTINNSSDKSCIYKISGTIELNNPTIVNSKVSAYPALYLTGGENTINGGSINAAARAIINSNSTETHLTNVAITSTYAGKIYLVTCKDSSTFEMNGGSITSTVTASNAISVQNDATVNIDGVTIEMTASDESGSPCGVGIEPSSSTDTPYVTIKNSTITATAFGVSTNASNAGMSYILIDKCNLTAKCALCNNIPGTCIVKNSTLIGYRVGAFIRGGKAQMSKNTITLDVSAMDEATAMTESEAFSEEWGQGNACTRAALTFGNLNNESYAYQTTVTLSDCDLVVTGTYNALFPVMCGQMANGQAVELSYDDACTFTGGKAAVYGSGVKVNGVTQ